MDQQTNMEMVSNFVRLGVCHLLGRGSTCVPLQLMEGIIWPYLYWVIRLLMYFFFHSVSMSLLTLRFTEWNSSAG